MKFERLKNALSGTVRTLAMLTAVAASALSPSAVEAAEYSVTVDASAASYTWSYDFSGSFSAKNFASTATWLVKDSTRIVTKSGGGTFSIDFSVSANTSSSSRTASISGTFNGSPLVLKVTQKGVGSSSTHVLSLYRNNSSGDGAAAKRTVANNAYFTLPTASSMGWTRGGYTFKGWATSRSATSATYSDGARIYVSSSLSTLYGVWQKNSSPTHVLSLYRNNSSGDGAAAKRTVANNAYFTLPTASSMGWTRGGYTFKGWATSRNATSATYSDGARIYVSSGLSTLYGVWQKNSSPTHVLSLYRNNSSGDGAAAKRTVANNAYFTLPTASSMGWTRSGYTFKGWATSRNTTSATYSDGARIYVSSSLSTLYGVWASSGEGVSYPVTVDAGAQSYVYSISFTGGGNMSMQGFASSASWLVFNKTAISTSSGGGTFYIYYSAKANTSSSSRTATISGTFGGTPVSLVVTQKGK